MKLTALLILISAFAMTGCISKRSGGTSFRNRTWTEGFTSKKDVVNEWGNPDAVEDNVWIWRERRHLGGRIKASHYGVGLTVSRINVAMIEHRLHFDGSGILDRQEALHSVPNGAEWSINPFD